MSWSYDPNLSTDKDQVRFNIGDTDSTDQQLSDEEINALLVSTGSVQAASVKACEGLIAKYARYAAQATGGISIQWNQLQDHYRKLIDDINSGAGTLAVTYAGGISIAEKQSSASDTDWDKPPFNVGMDDHPGTGSNN